VAGASDAEGHQDRVDVFAFAQVVALPHAFALEAERLVEAERGLVPREDVELQLPHAHVACPRDGLLEQCGAEAAASVRSGDHQPEVRDVPARGVRIPRERKPSDDVTVLLGDVDGCVWEALERT
jgi:hypothetical protein